MKVVIFTTSLKVALFFSSRRRHTTYIGDWSSDVCSSDLSSSVRRSDLSLRRKRIGRAQRGLLDRAVARRRGHKKIGRASCRERVENKSADARLIKRHRQDKSDTQTGRHVICEISK